MIELAVGEAPVLVRRPFWFLRHGQTDWNKDNLAQGAVNIPLNQDGIDQAGVAAKALEGRGIARIACSPLIRARVTAEIVAAELGLEVVEYAQLHEAAFGAREGEKMLAQWFSDWIDGVSTPPQGEPFAALRVRVGTAVNAVLEVSETLPLVVAHGAVFRAVRSLMGYDPHDRLMNAVPMYCAPDGAGWSISPA